MFRNRTGTQYFHKYSKIYRPYSRTIHCYSYIFSIQQYMLNSVHMYLTVCFTSSPVLLKKMREMCLLVKNALYSFVSFLK
jgi:hypothetical protein